MPMNTATIHILCFCQNGLAACQWVILEASRNQLNLTISLKRAGKTIDFMQYFSSRSGESPLSSNQPTLDTLHTPKTVITPISF